MNLCWREARRGSFFFEGNAMPLTSCPLDSGGRSPMQSWFSAREGTAFRNAPLPSTRSALAGSDRDWRDRHSRRRDGRRRARLTRRVSSSRSWPVAGANCISSIRAPRSSTSGTCAIGGAGDFSGTVLASGDGGPDHATVDGSLFGAGSRFSATAESRIEGRGRCQAHPHVTSWLPLRDILPMT